MGKSADFSNFNWDNLYLNSVEGEITIESMYQAFKERLMSEVEAKETIYYPGDLETTPLPLVNKDE